MPQGAEPLKTLVKQLLLKQSRRNLPELIDLGELEEELVYLHRNRRFECPINYVMTYRAGPKGVNLRCAGFELTTRCV